jgi:hypothetical protein
MQVTSVLREVGGSRLAVNGSCTMPVAADKTPRTRLDRANTPLARMVMGLWNELHKEINVFRGREGLRSVGRLRRGPDHDHRERLRASAKQEKRYGCMTIFADRKSK